LGAVVMFIIGRNSQANLAWYAGGGFALGGFIAMVVYHEHVRRQIQRYGVLGRINQQGLARMQRNWSAMPETSVIVPAEHQAVADDLDLFGHASLFQMMCAANTPIGIETLRHWLLERASAEDIRQR